MVTVTLFGTWCALRGGGAELLPALPRSASTLTGGGGAPDTDEVCREELETGEDATEEGEEEGEQQEDVVENEELRSMVSARSFTDFSARSVLNSDQSKVLERPSRLRSRTRLFLSSEALEAEALEALAALEAEALMALMALEALAADIKLCGTDNRAYVCGRAPSLHRHRKHENQRNDKSKHQNADL
ncbi:hypothetical protein EYF80_068176 [Liparis tanakae]|uniref:Uncharacterized protein n=1 Tax=Liparis tanakae TaxID=230148 RepID=A0A4Z2DZY7_9TELE|nr:hypothetical protein EYF80_068176 [Liparis tanakae]